MAVLATGGLEEENALHKLLAAAAGASVTTRAGTAEAAGRQDGAETKKEAETKDGHGMKEEAKGNEEAGPEQAAHPRPAANDANADWNEWTRQWKPESARNYINDVGSERHLWIFWYSASAVFGYAQKKMVN